MKILVVDDEELLVKGLKFNLENEGYEVDVCYDGQTAVEMAAANSYGLILLDLMMPKLDGLSACMRIREFSTVPIIMLTAKGEDTDKLIGFEYGADDYITKPYNILEVKARVRALLRHTGRSGTDRLLRPDHARFRHDRHRAPRGGGGRPGDRPHGEGIRPCRASHEKPRQGIFEGNAPRHHLGL